jgi:hypothetical protein
MILDGAKSLGAHPSRVFARRMGYKKIYIDEDFKRAMLKML